MSASRKMLPKDSFDLSAFLPGKKASKKPSTAGAEEDANKDKDFTGMPPPPSRSPPTLTHRSPSPSAHAKDNDTRLATAEFAEEEDDEGAVQEPLPIQEHVHLKAHERAVTALSIDPSGTRMLSGGYDYMVRFWDFNGMDKSLQSFREVEPWDGYQVKDIRWSLTGECFLVATGANRTKIYDRDGFQLHEYAKGDTYLMDMKNTKGHIAPLTCCAWHPSDRNVFMTAGLDSTIRIWDVENTRFQTFVTIAKSPQPGRLSAGITAAAFTNDGKMVVGARQDGGLSLWNYQSPNLRPAMHVAKAHEPNTDTSRVSLSSDNLTMVTRGGDDTVKLWDMRMFYKPVQEQRNLPNFFGETDVIFSPMEKYIVTGTSVKRGEGYGKLVFMDRYTLKIEKELEVSQSSAIRILWHPKLNQIFVGNSDHSISGLYDPTLSHKGLLSALSRKAKVRNREKPIQEAGIYLPNALLETEQESYYRQTKVSSDKFGSHMTGGSASMGVKYDSDTHLMSVYESKRKNTTRDEDPREALLKYAKEAEENPIWVNHVYKKTQPKPVFDYHQEDPEEEQHRNVKRRK